jgi:ABC-type oligopeptide transport system substrate-binding subunit
MDGEKRAKAYAEAERILLERDVVIYPLYYRKNTAVVGRRLNRFSISPLNYLFLKDVDLAE